MGPASDSDAFGVDNAIFYALLQEGDDIRVISRAHSAASCCGEFFTVRTSAAVVGCEDGVAGGDEPGGPEKGDSAKGDACTKVGTAVDENEGGYRFWVGNFEGSSKDAVDGGTVFCCGVNWLGVANLEIGDRFAVLG